MGCDIHCYKEKLVGGQWVTADEWVLCDEDSENKTMWVPSSKRFHERNYMLFGLLSRGVREEHPYSFEPRGLPSDVSPEVRLEKKRWNGDGHSHSHLYLNELKEMRVRLDDLMVQVKGMKDRKELESLEASIASGSPDWDLLFPYCGMTSDPAAVHFSLGVPASYYMGASLDRLISQFDGVDGDDHRFVFWFDN